MFGDLKESRTPIVGMKTRCTNRYTMRPLNIWRDCSNITLTGIIAKNTRNCKNTRSLRDRKY